MTYAEITEVAGKNPVLTLVRVWFDMILAGMKREEYRDDKPCWQARLLKPGEKEKDMRVCFRNGYDPESDAFLADVTAVRRSGGNPEWGYQKQGTHIVLIIHAVHTVADGRLKEVWHD